MSGLSLHPMVIRAPTFVHFAVRDVYDEVNARRDRFGFVASGSELWHCTTRGPMLLLRRAPEGNPFGGKSQMQQRVSREQKIVLSGTFRSRRKHVCEDARQVRL